MKRGSGVVEHVTDGNEMPPLLAMLVGLIGLLLPFFSILFIAWFA
jgi:hypothetical protein